MSKLDRLLYPLVALMVLSLYLLAILAHRNHENKKLAEQGD